jgi:hypothetical protein
VSDFQAPDRVVVGADDPVDGRRVADLYAALDTEIVHTDVASAEMIKLASNAFLATKISFVNEIANVCELVGRERLRGLAGHGPRPSDRLELPARRHRLRRQLLPEGRLRAEAAGGATRATTSSS